MLIQWLPTRIAISKKATVDGVFVRWQLIQIEALRSEAERHGDLAQVAICDLAIIGDESARRKCSDVIENAFNQD